MPRLLSKNHFVIAILCQTVTSFSLPWVQIDPNPLTYCPTSPIAYDCQYYQNNVWNIPSIASAPHTSSPEDPPLVVVFLPGTGSIPQQFQNGLLEAWRSYGRAHVLGQSYVSTPYPVSDMNLLCGDDVTNGGDSVATCLSRFHDTVAFGNNTTTSSSPLWSGLTASDSVEGRVLSSLQRLHQLDPTKGWDHFFTTSGDNITASLKWERVIISGHSQGGGHAAFLGHKRKTAETVLLSSPQDCCSYSTFANQPWLTPSSNISAFYHLYEDARGAIANNIAQIVPGATAKQFIPPFQQDLSLASDTDGRVYYSTLSPQPSCPCGSRQEHCSTALDSCSPVHVTSEQEEKSTVYTYHQLWQYLAFGKCVKGSDYNACASTP